MTPVGRDDPARRPAEQNSSVDWRNSENRREGQAPPLRGGGETSRNRGRAATEERPPRTMPSVGCDDPARRPQGKIPALAEEIPKTGRRGKPLPYGVAGKRPATGDGRPQRNARPPRTMPSVGRADPARRPAGRNPSVDRKIPKTGGRGKPLPYGMTGETSRNGERAATEERPPSADHDARRARRPGAPPRRAKSRQNRTTRGASPRKKPQQPGQSDKNREERSPCRSRARNCLYWRGRSPL